MSINIMVENNPNSILDNLLSLKKKKNHGTIWSLQHSPSLKDQQHTSIWHRMDTTLCSLPCTGSSVRGTLVLLGTEGVRFVVFYFCILINPIFSKSKVPALSVWNLEIKPKLCRYAHRFYHGGEYGVESVFSVLKARINGVHCHYSL